MIEKLLIISIVLSSLCLIGLVVFLIFFLRKGKNPLSSNQDKLLWSLESGLDSLKTNLPLLIEKTVSNEMLKVSSQLSNYSKDSNEEVSKLKNEVTQTLFNSLAKMQETLSTNVEGINKKVDDKFTDINDRVNKSLEGGFKETSETMGTVRSQLATMQEAQKNLDALSKQVVALNQALSHNQSRGKYGEMQLSMLLESIFQNGKGLLYDEQYVIKVKGEETVKPDAVIFFNSRKRLLCIDSKFPFAEYSRLFVQGELSDGDKAVLMSSFKRDVKSRIEEVRSKYLIEGITTNQALIFIPNDGIFAFIHSEYPDLVKEAIRSNVVLTSPSTLAPILVTFHAVQIDEERNKNLEKIKDALNSLGVEFERYEKRWNELAKNIESLQVKKDQMSVTVGKISNRFSEVSLGAPSKGKEEDLLLHEEIKESEES